MRHVALSDEGLGCRIQVSIVALNAECHYATRKELSFSIAFKTHVPRMTRARHIHMESSLLCPCTLPEDPDGI